MVHDPRLFYAEWGCEQGADIEDVENWYRANPALGIRIPEEFVRAELDAMRATPEQFARERLGVPELADADSTLIANWPALVDAESRIESHRSIALDVTPDRRFAALAWAGRRADGRLHVEAFDHRPGTSWLVESCKKLKAKWRLPIRVQVGSPAASLIDPLRAASVEVVELALSDHAKGLGQLLDAAANDDLRHVGGQTLAAAVKGADVRTNGDSDVLMRRGQVDISPLVAVVLAVSGVPMVRHRNRSFLLPQEKD